VPITPVNTTPIRIGPVALTAADQVVVTCPTTPAGVKMTLRSIDVCNTNPGAGVRKLTCYLVPDGGAIGDDTALAKDLEVARNASKGITVLDPGASIVARADAPGLTMSISGAQVTPA